MQCYSLKRATKTIANKIKLVLLNIVELNQSVFVMGRLIYDNSIIAYDIFHYMKYNLKGNKYLVVFKIDMENDYDKVKCYFLN